MKASLFLRCLAVFAAVCSVPAAHAQLLNGAIVGSVRDPSGKTIAKARVELRNLSTQLARTASTDDDGSYEAAGLPPGGYRLQASASGFVTKVIDRVDLRYGSRLRVDIDMTIGEVAVQVSVTEDSMLLETETGRLNLTIPERKVLDLPYNQLGTLNLGRYIPGTFPMSGNFEWSVAGLGNTQINQTFDGITVNNMNGGVGGGYYYSPTLDAVQEVSYTVLNQSAENPFATTFAVVSKSGGPQMHGSAWWYLSNNEWNARNFFARTAPTGKLNHRFGGTLGGPIVRDRTFYFIDLQQEKNTLLRQYNLVVPTSKLRGGNFSGLAAVRDPLSNTPFAGAQIPLARIPESVRRTMDFYLPQPNVANNDNFGFYNQTVERSTRLQHYNFRVDHRFGDGNTLMVRLMRQLATDYNNLSAPVPAWGEIRRLNPTWMFGAGNTWVLSPRVVNEARLGWSFAPDESSGDLRGADVVQQLGLTGYSLALPNVATVPAVSITGLSAIGSPRVPIREDRIWHASDTVTWMSGRHTIKAGTLVRPMTLVQQLPELQAVFGTFTFTGTYSGQGMGDFLLGLPQTTTRTARSDDIKRKITQAHWFAQDDIRLNNRLTLNLGLRFEWNPEPIEKNNNLVYIFDPRTGSVVVPTEEQRKLVDPRLQAVVPVILARDAGFDETKIIGQQNWYWHPRAGLAWRPFGDTRTVFRGGYGIYATDNANLFSPLGGPYTVNETFDNTIGANGPLFQMPRVFPADGSRSIAPGTLSISTQQRGRRVPYSQQWNLSAERELARNLAARLTYQGSKNTNLGFNYNLNQPPASTAAFDQSRRPFPLYRNITLSEFRGNSVFHGITAALTKRFADGFSFDLAYSWSKDISDAFTYFGGGNENRYDFRRDRGNTQYIPRQRFTAQYIWELPFGRGRKLGSDWSGPAQWIGGGWQISGFFAAQTGQYFTPTFSGPDTSNTQRFGGRADVVGEWEISNPGIQRWFNPSAFAIPANGRFGTVGPFTLVGPGRWVKDFGIYKEFALFGDRHRFRVEGTFINVFNHAAFAAPVSDITNPTAGQILATDGTEGGGGRTVQIGLRYRF